MIEKKAFSFEEVRRTETFGRSSFSVFTPVMRLYQACVQVLL